MKRILAIDDQKDNLTTIKAVLKNHFPNIKISTASSGKEGIEIAKKEQPDTILLNIVMPEMDGYEVCERLKTDKSTKHIPIILITAIRTDAENRIKGLNMGADAFLSKPIEASELKAQVNVMLRIKNAEDKLRNEKENLEKIVENRTSELLEKNIKLQSEIVKREIAENALRSVATEFSAISGQEFFEKVCLHLTKTLNIDYAFVGELSSDGNSVLVKTGIGKGEVLNSFDYQLADTPCENVIGYKVCVYPTKVQSLFPKDHLLVEMGIEGYLGVPLFDRNGVALGIMVLLNEKPIKDSGIASSILHIFSDRVATEIERMQAQELLKESEEKYRNLIEHAQDGICIIQDNKVKFMNSCLEKMWGGTKKEILNTPFTNYVHPDELDKIVRYNNERMKNKNVPSIYNTVLLHKDGHKVYAELSAGLISYKSKPANLIIIRDVTERILNEERIRKNDAQLKALLATIPDLVWMKDSDGKYLFCNQRFEDFFGSHMSEIRGKTDYDFVEKELADSFRQKDKESIALGIPNMNEEEVKFANDGHHEILETIKTPVYDPDGGIIGVLGVARDITERKNEEGILSSQIKLFEYALNHSIDELLTKFLDEAEKFTKSEIGFYHFIESDQETISLQSWSTNTMNNMCKVSEKATRHYPVSEAGVWVDCVKKKKPIIHNDYLSLKHKKGLPNGHAPIIRELVVPVIRGNKIVAILGVGNKNSNYTDVDVKYVQRFADVAWETVVRKQAEKILIESEERYRSLVTNLPVGVFRSTPEGEVLSANNTMAEIYGFDSIDELLKTKAHHYYTKKTPRDEMLKQLEKNGILLDYETQEYKKDGSLVLVSTNYKGIYNDKGELIYIDGVINDITGQRRAEDTIRESEEKYRELVEGTKNLITRVDINGNITFVNHISNEIYGLSPDECLGMNVFDFIHEDDKQKTKIWFEDLLKSNNKNSTFENRQVNQKNASIHNLLWTVNIKYDKNGNISGISSIAKDITEFKQAQRALKNSEAFLTETGRIAMVGGWELDVKTLELSWTDETYRIHEVPIGTNPPLEDAIKFFHPDDRPKLEKAIQKALNNGEPYNMDLRFTTAKGKNLWTRTICKPIVIDGKTVKLTGTFQDITANKEAEENLKTALFKATESDRLKSAFLATMSHELRTPLNAIIGFSDIINEELSNEEIFNFCKNINSSGIQLLSIVEDLFDISLIETGKTKITKKDEDLNKILNDIQGIVETERKNSGKENIALNVINPKKRKKFRIVTDASKLKQIIINLVKNAIKFTNEGHINYGFEITKTKKESWLKFFVEDTGIGIPENKQELIFDMFRQVDDSYTRSYGGTGIGLSISKKLVDLLGGKIWVESESGKGSTFYFTIPFEENIAKDNSEEKHTLPSYQNEDKTILIVEDDVSSLEFLKIILEKSKINILSAINGVEAIKCCKSNDGIDLVLMDINMPVMDGYIATRKIKKFRPNLPIIAQTAYAIFGDREKALAAGCDDYISKPIKKEILHKIIKNYI